MESEHRKEPVEIQSIFSDQENDALRLLAKLIARRHIRNQLRKTMEPSIKNDTNDDKDDKSSNE